ncbi:hypothetical protein ThvES_00006240 [Thiovulum sp. ES]|nr:hypothetical protein ThvES_00006240 [Thiovulum sp. ES]
MENLEIKMTGNKPVISHNGITFQPSKEDKYIYLQAVTTILKTLSATSENDEKHLENFSGNKFSDSEIIQTLLSVRSTFAEFYSENIEKYKERIEFEEDHVADKVNLSEMNKEILQNNYHMMHDYRLQRAKNKIVYEELVNSCFDLIKSKKISSVKVPFSKEFHHVMNSIKTTFEWHKIYDETLEISEDGKEITLSFIWR